MTKKAKLTNRQKIEEEKISQANTARVLTSPTANACLSIEKIFETTQPNQQALCDQLFRQTDRVVEKGDNTLVESMLLAQAQTLQAMFHKAVRRMENSQYIQQIQAYSEIAFKANNACRKSLLALQQIKNPAPSATFIKQQNNAVNQQINQSAVSENLPNPANELISLSLGKKSHETLDARGAITPSRVNQEMEAMAVSRGKDGGG